MEKRAWSTPVANVEQFLANEYVAKVCFGVGCDHATGGLLGNLDIVNPVTAIFGAFGTYHSDDGCGEEDNQFIIQHGTGTDATFTMEEHNTPWGTLDCTLYTGNDNATSVTDKSHWSTTTSQWTWDDVKDGQTVYWSTQIQWQFDDNDDIPGKTTMYHYGTVSFLDANRSNHS